MNGATVLTKFTSDTKGFDTGVQKVNASIGAIAKGTLVASAVTKGLSKAWEVFTQSLDGAISRYDTLSNFPKVMQNLGVSTKDSEKAISKISDKLTKLPTTLDSAAISVQRLTSKNGDLKKSTDMFLAMNNAILAGGAPMEMQQSALEQLTQAYAKGKPDLMEWRTLQQTMPGQLKQIAKSMGYVSDSALYEALKDGSVSMEDFMEATMRLNKEGLAGFKSFEKQAEDATGGIRTSITNMKTAFVRGVTDIISKTNEALEPIGGLAGVFSAVGSAVEKAFKLVGSALSFVIPLLVKTGKWIQKHKTLISALTIGIGSFIGVIYAVIKAFQVVKTIIAIINALKIAFALLNAVMMANPVILIVTLIIAAIVALVAVFMYLWKHCEGFRNFFIKMWEGIKTVTSKVIDWFKSIPERFTAWVNKVKAIFKLIVIMIALKILEIANKVQAFRQKILDFIKNIINGFKSLPGKIKSALLSVLTAIGTWVLNMKTKVSNGVSKVISSIKNAFKQLPSYMLNIGKNIVQGLWNGIQRVKDWVIDKIKGLGKAILKGMKKVLGISSPSKEFAIIGKFSILGYTEQLDKMKKTVQSQIADTFSLSPQVANSSSLNLSPNTVNNTYVEVKQDALGQTVKNIKTFSGGAKNDYNYGMGGR